MSDELEAPGTDPGASGWIEHAACKGMTDVFFAPDYENPAVRRTRLLMAQRTCAGCPVLLECRAWATAGGSDQLAESYAGGLTASERKQIRRKRGAIPGEPWDSSAPFAEQLLLLDEAVYGSPSPARALMR